MVACNVFAIGFFPRINSESASFPSALITLELVYWILRIEPINVVLASLPYYSLLTLSHTIYIACV